MVSSSGTDTYSAIAAALGSLKGPKHGGANIKVTQMFEDMKQTVKDWSDEEEVKIIWFLCCVSKDLIKQDLYTVWDMQYILCLIREQNY